MSKTRTYACERCQENKCTNCGSMLYADTPDNTCDQCGAPFVIR